MSSDDVVASSDSSASSDVAPATTDSVSSTDDAPVTSSATDAVDSSSSSYSGQSDGSGSSSGSDATSTTAAADGSGTTRSEGVAAAVVESDDNSATANESAVANQSNDTNAAANGATDKAPASTETEGKGPREGDGSRGAPAAATDGVPRSPAPATDTAPPHDTRADAATERPAVAADSAAHVAAPAHQDSVPPGRGQTDHNPATNADDPHPHRSEGSDDESDSSDDVSRPPEQKPVGGDGDDGGAMKAGGRIDASAGLAGTRDSAHQPGQFRSPEQFRQQVNATVTSALEGSEPPSGAPSHTPAPGTPQPNAADRLQSPGVFRHQVQDELSAALEGRDAAPPSAAESPHEHSPQSPPPASLLAPHPQPSPPPAAEPPPTPSGGATHDTAARLLAGTLILGGGNADGLQASQSAEANDQAARADRTRGTAQDVTTRIAALQGLLHFATSGDVSTLLPALRHLGEQLHVAPVEVLRSWTGRSEPETQRDLAQAREIVARLGQVMTDANAQLDALSHQKASTLDSVSYHYLRSYLDATVGQLRGVAYGETPLPLEAVPGAGQIVGFVATAEHTLGVPNVAGFPAHWFAHAPLIGAIARDSIERSNAADAQLRHVSEAFHGGVSGGLAAAVMGYNNVNPFYQAFDHGSRIVAAGRSGDWNTVVDHAIPFGQAVDGVRGMLHATSSPPETRNPTTGSDPTNTSSRPTSTSTEASEVRDTIVDPVPTPTATAPPTTPSPAPAEVHTSGRTEGPGEPPRPPEVETGNERPTVVPGDVSVEQAARAGRALAALEPGHRPSAAEATRMIQRVQEMGDIAQHFDSEQAARDATHNPRSIREIHDPREFRSMWVAAGGGEQSPPRAFATTNGATFIDQSRVGGNEPVATGGGSPPTPPVPPHVPIPPTRPGTLPPAADASAPAPAADHPVLDPHAAAEPHETRLPDSVFDRIVADELADRPATLARVTAAFRDLRQVPDSQPGANSEAAARAGVNLSARAAQTSVDRVYNQAEANRIRGDRLGVADSATYNAEWHLHGGAPDQPAPPAYRTSDGEFRVRYDPAAYGNPNAPTAEPVGTAYQPADLARIAAEAPPDRTRPSPQPAPAPPPVDSNLGTAPTQLNMNPAPSPRPIPPTRPGTLPPASDNPAPAPAPRDTVVDPHATAQARGPRLPDSAVDRIIAHELADRPATEARVNAAMRDLRQGGTDFDSELGAHRAVDSMAGVAKRSVDRVYTQPEANELLRKGGAFTNEPSFYEAEWHLNGGAADEPAPPAFRTSDGQVHTRLNPAAWDSGTERATPVGTAYQPADLTSITNENSAEPARVTPTPASPPQRPPNAGDASLGLAPTQLNLNPASAPRVTTPGLGPETGNERPTLVPGEVSGDQAARAGRALAAMRMGHEPTNAELTEMIHLVQDMGEIAQRFNSEQAARDATRNPRSVRECHDSHEFRAMWTAAGGGDHQPRAFMTTNGATYLDQSGVDSQD
jgi:hypothetical protein